MQFRTLGLRDVFVPEILEILICLCCASSVSSVRFVWGNKGSTTQSFFKPPVILDSKPNGLVFVRFVGAVEVMYEKFCPCPTSKFFTAPPTPKLFFGKSDTVRKEVVDLKTALHNS